MMATWRIGEDWKEEDAGEENPVREGWKRVKGMTLEEYRAHLKTLTTLHEVLDAGPGIDNLDDYLWRDQDTGRDFEF